MKRVALVALALGCGGAGGPAAPGLDPIRVGWQTTWATQGQLAVLLQQGELLREAGFDATFVGFSYGGPLNEGALAGEVDVLFTADQPALSLCARAPAWGAIGRLMYNRVGMFVPPGSPVGGIADLKGGALAVPFGAAAHREALGALTAAGLDPKADVRVLNLGLEEIVALVGAGAAEGRWGEVDAAAAWDPAFANLEHTGAVRTLSEATVTSLVVMDDAYAAAHPGAAGRFLGALSAAYGQYRGDTDAANAAFKVASKLPFDVAVLDRAAAVEPNLAPDAPFRLQRPPRCRSSRISRRRWTRPPACGRPRPGAEGMPEGHMPNRHISGVVAGLLALALWEGGARALATPALPGPGEVAAAFIAQLRGGGLLADVGASLRRVLVGYALASVAGVAAGGLAALGGRVGDGVTALANLLRPIPPIAWVPLAILWLGLGDASAVFIVFVGAFFPIFLSVVWAVGHCPPGYLELARSLGASPWLTLTRVRLPAAAPGVAAGLRTGLGLAWTSVIAAELVGAQSGLGYRIQMHRLVLETEGVLVGMLCIGALGLGMDAVARAVERRALAWERA